VLVAGLAARVAVAQQSTAPAAPAAETGTVAGTVVDKSTGDPVIEAGVEVVDTNKKVSTDLDGRYKLDLPPGTYQLRFFAPLYQPVRVQGVVVKVRTVTKQNVTLAAAKANVEVVEVIARADRAAEATQLTDRKNAAVVKDTVSAETITKSPDKDAASVVKRIPAVTIREGKFVFVRGLGERYSSALLDGSRLPSTDPSKRVVPLDLFPAEFLESLGIIKSYTPDLPGDFSGGLVDIHLREFPEQLSFSTGVSTNFNSQTTFQSFRTYRGGSLDYLGFGSNFRALPGRVPDTATFHALENDEAQRDMFGRDFKNIWNPETMTAPPGSAWNFAAGNTWGPLGVEFGGLYRTDYLTTPDETVIQYRNNGNLTNPKINVFENFKSDTGLFTTRMGGLMTASYRLSDTDKLFFRSLIDRNTFDTNQGTNGIDDQGLHEQNTIFRYTEEELDFGQLGGEHRWSQLWLDWRTAYSRTLQNEPDTRFITYAAPPGEQLQFTTTSSGGTRTFNDLKEYLTDSAVDLTLPFTTGLPSTDVWSGLPAKFKFGPAYSYRTRNFDQRRFEYGINGPALDLTAPPETILAPSNIVPGVIDFDETTQATDHFDVSEEIIAGYGMFDLPLIRDRLRLVSGVREEYSNIVLKTGTLASGAAKIIKKNVDPLPGANLIFSPREDMNFRFSYSRSVSRPEFRELSPTQFPEPRALRPTIGNPFLVEAHLENFDFRWEWFFSPLELVSLSAFHKNLDQPIESVVIQEASSNANSWANAQDGTLTGFEFEGRKSFGFLSPRLTNLSLLTNVAYIGSNVNIPQKKLEAPHETSRALVGQAPYIVNAVLDYTHPRWGTYRLLYNTAGPTIVFAGTFALPDIEEQQRNQLDFVALVPVLLFNVPFTFKLSAENLLDDQVLQTQGGLVQDEFTKGVKVTIGLQYTH